MSGGRPLATATAGSGALSPLCLIEASMEASAC